MSHTPNLSAQIEAILFVEAKAVSFKRLATILETTPEAIAETVEQLRHQYDAEGRGIRVVAADNQVQLVTAPELHDTVTKVIKDERTGELTRPSVETLAIIAYRNPITKAEIEMIRGVNCTMIIRNLLIRGLISERLDKVLGVEVYDVTPEYLQILGVSSTHDLPNYETLSRDLNLNESLAAMEASEDFFQNVEQIGMPNNDASSAK